MQREDVRSKIEKVGIVAAIREHSKENALFAAEAVCDGGIPIVEISLTVPGETEVISHLVKEHPRRRDGVGDWQRTGSRTSHPTAQCGPDS